MKTVVLSVLCGVLLTLILGTAAVYIYFAFGIAPVATDSEAMPFEKRLADMALEARIDNEAPRQIPIKADDNDLMLGAHIYVEHCAICHGMPGKKQDMIGTGEFPTPPHLFRGKGVTDNDPGQTYWKVANGIRLTGMPAFKPHLSEREIWQVSLVLANANKLPAAVTAYLNGPDLSLQSPGETKSVSACRN